MFVAAQGLSFQRINSGTKTNIRAIKIGLSDGKPYFLTDRIYAVRGTEIKRTDMPVPGNIGGFVPFSEKECWFSVNLNTNNSALYHYKAGHAVPVATPLSNQIDYLQFYAPHRGFVAGSNEMYFFENNRFFPFHPTPPGFFPSRVFFKDSSNGWLLDDQAFLIRYQQAKYQKIVLDQPVKDFCFSSLEEGYALSGDRLYKITGLKTSLLLKDPRLLATTSLARLKNGHLVLVGRSGTVLEYSNGRLYPYQLPYPNDLGSVAVSEDGGLWVGGTNGALYYSGPERFSPYKESAVGFTAKALIPYAIPLDGEYGVAIADFNGDRKPDIYAVRIFEQNRFYINRNQKGKDSFFTEEAVLRNALGLDNPLKNSPFGNLKLGIGAADVDNDGDPDIYLCFLNGPNKLLINKGNGYFRNVSAQKLRASEDMNRSNAAVFADVDQDGDLDLFVTSEYGTNRLFENDGTGHFKDITATSGLASQKGGMCASFGDINQDGLPDLCVSFWYPSNKLYVNQSKKGRIFFKDITALTDLAQAPPAKSNGVSFADVNNDGHLDLFIANRNTPNKLYINDGNGVFKDKTTQYFEEETFVSYGASFADFDLDGYQDLYLANVGGNVLYKNMGGRYFMDVTSEYGAGMIGYCTGSATGDIDGDGDPDLYVANYINGNSQLFVNDLDNQSFIKFSLQGVLSNRDAIGAKIWLFKKLPGTGQQQLMGYREVNGGNGYASISDKEVIFGCDTTAQYFALIKFPSTPDTIRLEHLNFGTSYLIKELEGLRAFFIELQKSFVSFFKNRENHPEQLKFLFLALVLTGYCAFFKKPRSAKPVRRMAVALIFLAAMGLNLFFLYQWPGPSYFIAPIVALSLLIVFHLFMARYLLVRLSAREKQRLREKLSRDLHDDLASTLGSISIYSETLRTAGTETQKKTAALPAKIAHLSQAALNSVSDIIWMTSPKNDTLESLISKLHLMMQELLTDNGIHYTSQLQIGQSSAMLPENLRNNVFLILKEAAHNIVKHSKASKVVFAVQASPATCRISLTDDGAGFDPLQVEKNRPGGNGLPNMKKRASESGIEFNISSGEKKGTEISLRFKI